MKAESLLTLACHPPLRQRERSPILTRQPHCPPRVYRGGAHGRYCVAKSCQTTWVYSTCVSQALLPLWNCRGQSWRALPVRRAHRRSCNARPTEQMAGNPFRLRVVTIPRTRGRARKPILQNRQAQWASLPRGHKRRALLRCRAAVLRRWRNHLLKCTGQRR